MNAKPIDGPMKWLRFAFVGYVASLVLLFIVSYTVPDDSPAGDLATLAVLLLFVSAFAYLITLGQVAARTGRSVITWVGLTILLSPFSYFFAYPMMKSKVGAATTPTATP